LISIEITRLKIGPPAGSATIYLRQLKNRLAHDGIETRGKTSLL
jgi:hypothetical protein